MSEQRESYKDFASKWCGLPYAELERGGTTGLDFGWACWKEARKQSRIQRTDARELTAEQAVERVLQMWLDRWTVPVAEMNSCLCTTNMTASIHNGKVRVRRAKR